MPTLVRAFSALALAALVALAASTGASAAKTPKVATWAKKHHLSGSWRTKDADKDGAKNLAEYKLGTHPRKADTDKDGLKDGDEVTSANDPLKADTDADGVKDGGEHAGVVSAFDGDTITIRQFKGGTLTAAVDDGCDDSAGDASIDDEFAETEEGEWTEDVVDDDGEGAKAASVDEDEPELDLGEDESCDPIDVETGAVLTSAELELRDGDPYVVAVELA